MDIRLWSRATGLVTPPETLLYAEAGGHTFSPEVRNRLLLWGRAALQRLQWGDGMGEVLNSFDLTWERLERALSAAYGRHPLVAAALPITDIQMTTHLRVCADNEVIDYVDAVFQVFAQIRLEDRDLAQDELAVMGAQVNVIFEEEGIGYRWVSGQIVRFDEEVTHEEAVRPALAILAHGNYGAARQEFTDALEAYRAGRWRDAVTNANAAFESVLKIRTNRPNLKAGPLIAEARRQGAIPGYMQASVESLASVMHTLPATRAQEGSAHGLGERDGGADAYLAQLIISLAAAFILFIGRPA